MSVNIFGSSGDANKSSGVDKKYVDQKFITLSTNLATKIGKSGDTVSGNIIMKNSTIKMSLFPKNLLMLLTSNM